MTSSVFVQLSMKSGQEFERSGEFPVVRTTWAAKSQRSLNHGPTLSFQLVKTNRTTVAVFHYKQSVRMLREIFIKDQRDVFESSIPPSAYQSFRRVNPPTQSADVSQSMRHCLIAAVTQPASCNAVMQFFFCFWMVHSTVHCPVRQP